MSEQQAAFLSGLFTARTGCRSWGRVIAVQGPLITARLPCAALGDHCGVEAGGRLINAQVVSFQGDLVQLAPLDAAEGIAPSARVTCTGLPLTINPPYPLPGRVLDPLGRDLRDGAAGGAQGRAISINIERRPPNPLERPPLRTRFSTGIMPIDALCTIAYGQRIGLFAAPGLGKSSLLAAIAKKADADVIVAALVGERGREVRQFLDEGLGPKGLKRAVVVAATSDDTAALRALAPRTAIAVAEHFRDKGKRVLLLIDSLTRAARALREVGLAAGEMPVRQGYPASVYSELPRMIERCGTSSRGSITAIFTILTQADYSGDALGEEVKSLLDGHIVLDQLLAERGIYPAIDFTASLSRLCVSLCSPAELEDSRALLQALAALKRDKDALLFGGTPDPALAASLAIETELMNFLMLHRESYTWQDLRAETGRLASAWRSAKKKAEAASIDETS